MTFSMLIVKLYNTLTRKKEEFKPLYPGEVGLYTCGPTVYNYAHLGNLRTYIFEDILRRVLVYNGYKVKHVMNVTDVGHLTGDRDMGEDKLEKSAKRENKNAWQLAEFYWTAFREDMAKLNIIEPDIWCKATDNIPEQIELIKQLEIKGFTYRTNDGIYYDTAKFKEYNKLSHLKLDELKEGARVEINKEKKNPIDFALWKFSPKNEKRQMEWASPWGLGFPGWHIECAAMSMKFLGTQLDIHTGGVDHINIHHTNEIAEAEAVTHKKFFNYWLHGAFLNITGGKKMAKSAENFLTVENALVKHDINPLAFRYAAMQTHYRKPMEYDGKSIKAAEAALNNLYREIKKLKVTDKLEINIEFKNKFLTAINNDLNATKALAVVFELLKSDLSAEAKKGTLLDFDKVLGLDFIKIKTEKIKIPPDVLILADERQKARANKEWARADELRVKIQKMGFLIEDKNETFEIKKIKK